MNRIAKRHDVIDAEFEVVRPTTFEKVSRRLRQMWRAFLGLPEWLRLCIVSIGGMVLFLSAVDPSSLLNPTGWIGIIGLPLVFAAQAGMFNGK